MLRREDGTRQTADFIITEAGRLQAEWVANHRLSAVGMPMPLPRDQGLHPVGCELQACTLSFRFEASRHAELVCAEFQMQVEGWLVAGDSMIELQDHWRIDTVPAEHEGLERESHPRFHFQRGGHAQTSFAGLNGFVPGLQTPMSAGNWRGLMQYQGPRVPSLPFDPILAIDFCVAQNDGPLWTRLRNVPEYFNVVEAAQRRLWRPFLESMATAEGRRRWLGALVTV